MAGSPTSHPRVNIQLLPAPLVDAFDDRRDIIFGQIAPPGNAVSLALVTDLQVMTDAEIQTLFGTGEMYWRIVSWREGVQVSDGGILPKLDAIGVNAAGGGVPATSDLVVAGPATSDGSFSVSVIDEERFTVQVQVTNGDTADTIAAAINTALTAVTVKPFTNSVLTDTVTITALDDGTIGNTYGIKVNGNVTGVSFTTNAFSAGAVDPTITSILDAIEGRRYTGFQWPESWDRTLIVNEVDSRFNVANDILDGVVFQGFTDTYANILAEISTLNSQSLVLMGNNLISEDLQKGPAILQPADYVASYFMGVRDKRLTTGALIADLIVASNAPADATGGPALASLPYFNTPLEDTPVTQSLYLFNSTEQLDFENQGFTSYGVNTAGNTMLMGTAVTTRTTDAVGNANESFLYLNYVDTGSVCREIFFRVLKSTFAQSRLTEGNIIPGRSMANALSIKAELLAIYRVLADQALTQAGSDAEAYFDQNTTVVVSLAERLVTINGVLPIVTQLGTINYNLALSFTINQTGTQIIL